MYWKKCLTVLLSIFLIELVAAQVDQDKTHEIFGGCTINQHDVVYDSPMVLDEKYRLKSLPHDKEHIQLENGETVRFYCLGKDNLLLGFADRRHDFKCSYDLYQTKTGDYSFNFTYNEITCQKLQKRDVEKVQSRVFQIQPNNAIKLLSKSRFSVYDIGHWIDKNFIQQVRVFVDEDASMVIGSVARVSKKPQKTWYDEEDSEDLGDNCCDGVSPHISDIYLEHTESMGNQFKYSRYTHPGEQLLSVYPLTSPKSMQDALGYLAATSSFNFVPIWDSIANGNWLKISNHIDKLARQLDRDLYVLSGAHDILLLDNIFQSNKPFTDYKQPAFYYAKEVGDFTDARFPIPLYVFKIIIDKETREGVVFVTVNNPYLDIYGDSNFIKHFNACHNDIEQHSDFSFWEDLKLGYTFACTVTTFLKEFQYPVSDFSTLLDVGGVLAVPSDWK